MNFLNQSNQAMNSTQADEQDSAVVYSSTPFGGIQGQRLAGNRKRDPISAFRISLARFLALPSDLRLLIVDQASWLFGSMGIVYILRFGGELALMIMGLPLATFLLLLIIALWYFPELRLMTALRLLAVFIAIVATLL